ncbi:MAG: hypothetical protein HY429_02310, partial [Candidatus Levybacteria bacterium]|nr:hypothetical protein [Candidatus Levybacteria bacterium]
MKLNKILLITIVVFFLLSAKQAAAFTCKDPNTQGLCTFCGDNNLPCPFSSNGTDWKGDIINDGSVYSGGESMGGHDAMFWCGTKGIAHCDETSEDFMGLAKDVKVFMVTVPSPQSIYSNPFSYSFPSPWPCGRVQGDVALQFPVDTVIGGETYSTGVDCPIPTPTPPPFTPRPTSSPTPPPTNTPTPIPPSPTPKIDECYVAVTTSGNTATGTVGYNGFPPGSLLPGYNRVNWYIDNIYIGTNTGPSASKSELDTTVSHTFGALEWDINGVFPAKDCGDTNFSFNNPTPTPGPSPTSNPCNCGRCQEACCPTDPKDSCYQGGDKCTTGGLCDEGIPGVCDAGACTSGGGGGG